MGWSQLFWSDQRLLYFRYFVPFRMGLLTSYNYDLLYETIYWICLDVLWSVWHVVKAAIALVADDFVHSIRRTLIWNNTSMVSIL